MEATPAGMEIEVKEEQAAKAKPPMEVTLLGMEIDVREVQP